MERREVGGILEAVTREYSARVQSEKDKAGRQIAVLQEQQRLR